MHHVRDVIQRPDFSLQTIVPLVTLVFTWWMGASVFVATGAFVAAAIVAAILRPRRPGRWTE